MVLKVLSVEKRQSTKTESQVEQEAQSFHHFVHSVHRSQFCKIHDQDICNTDEMPFSLTGHMKREMKSLIDQGTPNDVRLSPFTLKDFKRSMTVVLTTHYVTKVNAL